ncbi:hypothetical protein KUCAC02_016183 [Chaenocephalus aceratus]|uniref:Uncharacterized protein n=1 Tax=Chaenocephalus aceratus TaxID=36190 RepID=A0ACB9Y107_CHAAC|nr:hypothetical protein KUCAC02_016183 [Chaenocephalus aceratus]
MHRLKIISGHLSPPGSSEHRRDLWRSDCGAIATESPQDVVVVHGLRTAVCKAKRGAFKDTTPDEMLSAVMKAVMTDVGLSADKLGDVCVGNVLQPGAGALVARIAHFLSGFPETVPVSTVNRQCSSGLQALFNIAGAIRGGSIDLGLACGSIKCVSFVCVSFVCGVSAWRAALRSMGDPGDLSPRLTDFDKARDCIIPMGVTSENVAEKFGVSREKQDAFALSSQRSSIHVFMSLLSQSGAGSELRCVFEQEIVPVSTRIIDEDGTERELTVAKDDGIRAGNHSLRTEQTSRFQTGRQHHRPGDDGAAAVLIGRRSAVEALGLPVLGVLRASAVVGVPPDLMGIGPAYAPAALKQAGLTVADIDVFEINEAFASQVSSDVKTDGFHRLQLYELLRLYCVEHLGIPLEKVNPNGGAIALGHPLGCTGARQVVTLLHELRRRGQRAYGVVSMCIGTGMGAAAVFEYPGP